MSHLAGWLTGLAALLLVAAPAAAGPAGGEARAALLYQNHCTGCHESAVHIRQHSQVRNLKQLEHWVRYWVQAQGLGWSDADIAGVALLLDGRHYDED